MSQRCLLRVFLVAGIALSLSGCSSPGNSDTTPSAPSSTPASTRTTATPKPSPSPSPTPTTPLTPKTRPLQAKCHDDRFTDTVSVTSLEEAWLLDPAMRAHCEVSDVDSSVLLVEETEALQTTGRSIESLDTLYSMCMETQVYPEIMTSLSAAQIPEANGMLTLCPEHDDAARVQELIDAGIADQELEAAGQLFGPGTFRIGAEIQPGRYYSERSDGSTFEGCYWEVTDSAGNIVDNNFVTSAFRAEVSIPSSGYSFTSESCGVFRPVERHRNVWA